MVLLLQLVLLIFQVVPLVSQLVLFFNLATCAFSLLTRGFELVTRRFELVTREFGFKVSLKTHLNLPSDEFCKQTAILLVKLFELSYQFVHLLFNINPFALILHPFSIPWKHQKTVRFCTLRCSCKNSALKGGQVKNVEKLIF